MQKGVPITEFGRRRACVAGGATELAVAALWGGRRLHPQIRAVSTWSTYRNYEGTLGPKVGELVTKELAATGEGSLPTPSLVRALLALASLEGSARSASDHAPEWTEGLDGPVELPGLDVEQVLVEEFPEDWVEEVRQLAMAAMNLMPPRPSRLVYSPVFHYGPDSSAQRGMVAEGDFLANSTLIELKVRKTALGVAELKQVMGYVALSHLRGGRPIRRILIVNARRGEWWRFSVAEAIERSGLKDIEDLARRFSAAFLA